MLLGPVMGELEEAFAPVFHLSLLGIGAQGWLRRLGRDNRVRQIMPADFHAHQMLRHARALFLSDEDIPPGSPRPRSRTGRDHVQIIAFTRGYNGADICVRGNWRHIAAFPAKVVDPTGAGDVFAAAFLIRLWESGDVWKATRFAACARLLLGRRRRHRVRSRRGTQVEARLKEHPNIVARVARRRLLPQRQPDQPVRQLRRQLRVRPRPERRRQLRHVEADDAALCARPPPAAR